MAQIGVGMLFCIAEDRGGEEVGVRLLLLSIRAHCPEAEVCLIFPPATDAFRTWLRAFPNVELRMSPISGAYGWNVKPQVFLMLMDEGYTELVWLDSDIIFAGDPRLLLCDLTAETIVVCEEAFWGQHQGGSHRAESWGFIPARSLPATANSAFMRVTSAHRDLLAEWQRLLLSEPYRQAQALPILHRPIHLVSDQEVLTGLLSATPFAHLPIRFMRRGRDIIHCFGPGNYTVMERVSNMCTGLAPLVHAMGSKPWHFKTSPRLSDGLRNYYDALAAEVSPYCHIANLYRNSNGMPTPWLSRTTLIGAVLKLLGLRNPSLCGLPLAIFDEAVREAKHLLGVDRYHISPGGPS